jgi:transcriptional regulator with XRE-family HTH domain
MQTVARPVGELLRDWRHRRRLSQLDLALDAEISPRHLSFLETGRSTPSREMVLRLAERLDIPLRERNTLLLAAGYAPAFRERPLGDPELVAAKQAVDLVLAAHEPHPALAIDRHWNLVASNRMVAPFLAGLAPMLLEPPINVLRLSLHPEGLAPRIQNALEWRTHLFARLRRQIDVSGDPVLTELLNELRAYSPPDAPKEGEASSPPPAHAKAFAQTDVVVPLRLSSELGTLSLISTTTVFGTPVDITLSELALETFFPADTTTANLLRTLAAELR